MRINKFLAGAGLGSRRKCEKLVEEGKVFVNGKVLTDLAFSVSENDKVVVDGKQVVFNDDYTYVMLNKPKGYITTTSDEKGRKTVMDLLPSSLKDLKPVGRLDYDSEGLLILTNDGELIYKLTHPAHNIEKTYVIKVEGEVKESQLACVRAGVVIDGVRLTKCRVKFLEKVKDDTKLEVVITEGRNRQIRKMFEAVGLNVCFLKRIKEGDLRLSGVSRGEYRKLRDFEVEYLKSL